MDAEATDENPSHVRTRAPYPASSCEGALRIAMGNHEGASFRVKVDGLEIVGKSKLPGGGRIIHAVVPAFDRAAIAFSGKVMNRMMLLGPSPRWNWFEFGEAFSIRGYYEVLEKVNDAQRASERFRAFSRVLRRKEAE